MAHLSMSDLSFCWRGPMSISNIGVYGTDVQRLTNPLIGVSEVHLTWPPSTIRHWCAMFKVSHWDDRRLIGTIFIFKISLF